MSSKRYIVVEEDTQTIFNTLNEADAYIATLDKNISKLRLFLECFNPHFRCELSTYKKQFTVKKDIEGGATPTYNKYDILQWTEWVETEVMK